MLLWQSSIVCLLYLFDGSLLKLPQAKDAALAKQHSQHFSGQDSTSSHYDDKSLSQSGATKVCKVFVGLCLLFNRSLLPLYKVSFDTFAYLRLASRQQWYQKRRRKRC
jgi:hypothetical protein